MLELVLRLVFSLAAVLGLLALLARFGARRFRGGRDSMIKVLHRQHISRGTAVSVVAVGSRVLVLGTTEHQVRVLAELDPDEIADPADLLVLPPVAEGDPEPEVQPAPVVPAAPTGQLAGSVLSIDTWRQALAAATRKAS
ncbi:flagellar biosynthetic protein FliO [Nocardioides sp. CN2-186]|uniref:flagellar biosynthetic protein FliO n=1 Tax=Nocardioides tweenelious TaxID=3156607 RepID=UPI0032B3B2EC